MHGIIEKVWIWIKIILLPEYWVQFAIYNKRYDQWLLHSMATHDFENIGEYNATINGVDLCIAYHPYMSFTRKFSEMLTVRPSRSTIMTAFDKLLRQEMGRVSKGISY
jgi:hypothetical protein